jgi:glutamate synthase (NADPH/NADH) small chain
MRTSSSQAEGAEREFAAATLGIEGKNGRVTGVLCARVDEKRQPIPGSEFVIKADSSSSRSASRARQGGPLEQAEVSLDRRGNVQADDRAYRTSPRRSSSRRHAPGPVLVVWAIREGRQAARAIDLHLTGATTLPV